MKTLILNNSLKVLHEKNNSNIINIRLIVNHGSVFETSEKEHGISHFLEHLFFKRTKSKSTQEINNLLAFLGSSNAYTSYDKVVFHITTNNENIKISKAVGLLMELLYESAFTLDDFEKEKKVILEEIKTRKNTPFTHFYVSAINGFLNNCLGHDAAGTEESIKQMQYEDVIQYMDKFYSNHVFSICGNIKEDKVLSIFNNHMKNMICTSTTDIIKEYDFNGYNNSDLFLSHPTKDQAFLMLNFRSMGTEYHFEKDSKTIGVFELITNIIGCGWHSLLYNRLREELGYCYSIGTYYSMLRTFGFVNIYVILNKDNIDKSEKEIFKILNALCNGLISSELLQIAKDNLIFELVSCLETSRSFSQEIFDLYYANSCRLISPIDIIDKIRNTTIEDIKTISKYLFKDMPCKKVIMNG